MREQGNQLAWLYPGAITLIVLASLGAWLFNRRRASLVIAFSMISLAFAFVLTTIVTSFHPRYMLPYSLVLFVLIGGALAGFREGSQRRAIVAGLIMLIAGSLTINGWSVASELQYSQDHWRDVAV